MRTTILLGLACTLSLGGCDSDDDDQPAKDAGQHDSGPPDSGGAVALRVATYNTGLLDSVGRVAQRAPEVTEALAALDADVLCVQEVWQQEHWDALVEANEGVRPHVLRFEPMPGVQGKCTPDEFAPVLACAEQRCADAGASDLVSCTAANCGEEVAAVSTSCITCLIDNGGSGDFDAIEAACVGASSAAAGEPLPPEERSYFLGGSFGIGLLSQHAFSEEDSFVLDSSTTRRGILYAKIDTGALGELSVFCTHTTPDLPSVGYDGSYGSWSGENAAHIAALIEWVDEKTSAGDPVLVLGDLNAGPAGRGIKPELADSYAQLPAAGFADPFLDGPDAACTFCSQNALVIPGDTGIDAVIDHVLLRDVPAKVSVERIFTDEVPLGGDSDADAGGASASLPRSDHYGLQATFR